MFELQRRLNPDYAGLYEEAEKYLKGYPWLLDFCTYLNLDRPLNNQEYGEWYYVHSEVCWIRMLSKWEMKQECDMPTDIFNEICNCHPEDMVPATLKVKLFNLFIHFGGDSASDMMKRFVKWYHEHYIPDMPLYKMSRGKIILNSHRLKCLEFMSDYGQALTEDQSYSNTITDAVDSVFDDDIPIMEDVMCKALEYSEANNLKIAIVPDEGHTRPEYNCPVHIEYIRISGDTAELS